MPLITKPYLKPMADRAGETRRVLGFVYNFAGDSVLPQAVNGLAFTGSLFKVTPSSVGLPAVMPEVRSCIFSLDFAAASNGGDAGDGEFMIQVPSTGQVMRFGVPQSTATGNVLTACVPILSDTLSGINFIKAVNGLSETMNGLLTVSLFNFDIAPFIYGGSINAGA